MIFNSLAFFFFFIIVIPAYFFMPFRLRWIFLLLASCFFYMFFKPVYILILGGTIIVDYFAGILLQKDYSARKRLLLLICSFIANIGVLVFFKYFNFVSDNFTWLSGIFGYKNHFPYLDIILPVGLSFHTFQAMSYTIEVYRRKYKAETHFGYYALYVMYFPQLVAGPIERPQNILYQFHSKHDFNYNRTVSGLKLMLWGLFKKIVIADTLATPVNAYYANVFHTNNNPAIIIILFSFQIYCDFSGYTDIAIGVSRIMGIELMRNFNYPYFAHTINAFWRRWHISLSTWFRDYLYIPLGGSKTQALYIRNVLIVFLISGLWHGASWTFIIWGFIHGVLSITERLLKIDKSKNLLMGLFSFSIISLAWIFFRAENFHVAAQVFQNLTIKHLDLEKKSVILLFLFISVEYFVYKKHAFTIFDLIPKKPLRYAVYLLMIEMILFAFNNKTVQQFIYFQF